RAPRPVLATATGGQGRLRAPPPGRRGARGRRRELFAGERVPRGHGSSRQPLRRDRRTGAVWAARAPVVNSREYDCSEHSVGFAQTLSNSPNGVSHLVTTAATRHLLVHCYSPGSCPPDISAMTSAATQPATPSSVRSLCKPTYLRCRLRRERTRACCLFGRTDQSYARRGHRSWELPKNFAESRM
ncbi:MAG: hypothetical protein QOH57_319, partial [Mycobacterium sp.]|nr:hypothetical protein [Mycobacterium sp.]